MSGVVAAHTLSAVGEVLAGATEIRVGVLALLHVLAGTAKTSHCGSRIRGVLVRTLDTVALHLLHALRPLLHRFIVVLSGDLRLHVLLHLADVFVRGTATDGRIVSVARIDTGVLCILHGVHRVAVGVAVHGTGHPVGSLVVGVADSITGSLNTILNSLTSGATGVDTGVDASLDTVVHGLHAVIDSLHTVVDSLSCGPGFVSSHSANILTSALHVIPGILGIHRETLSGVPQIISELLTCLLRGIPELLAPVHHAVVSVVHGLCATIDRLTGGISGVSDSSTTSLYSLLSGVDRRSRCITGRIVELVDAGRHVIGIHHAQSLAVVLGFISNLLACLLGCIDAIVDGLTSLVDHVAAAKIGVRHAGGEIVNCAIVGIADGLASTVHSITGSCVGVRHTSRQIIDSTIIGVGNSLGAVVDGVTSPGIRIRHASTEVVD